MMDRLSSVIILLFSASITTSQVRALDLADVSKSAEEISDLHLTSPHLAVHAREQSTAETAPKTVLNAGIFRHPAVYIPPGAPSSRAVELRSTMRSMAKGPLFESGQFPTFVPGTGLLTLPWAAVDGVVYDRTLLRLESDGTFALVNAPQIKQDPKISAANYREGTLLLTALYIGKRRYSNVKLQLNALGRFELVDSFVPIPVPRTSTEAQKALPFGAQVLPVFDGLFVREIQQVHARGFADFTQTGQYTYFADVMELYGSTNPRERSTFHFFQRTGDQWAPVTRALIHPSSEARGCEHSRKAVIADFNGDQLPDVFVACHGSEHPDVLRANGGVPRERPYIILSRLDGAYQASLVEIPEGMYHSAVAIDLEGRGFADIYTGNQLNEISTLIRLRNKGDGTFSVEPARGHLAARRNIWSLEALRIDGNLHLILAGSDDELDPIGGLYPSVFRLADDGTVSPTPIHMVPNIDRPPSGRCGSSDCFSISIDVLPHGDKLFVLKVRNDYGNYAIVEYDMRTKAARYVHVHDGSAYQQYAPGIPMPECRGFHGSTWIDFIRVFDGKIITDAKCWSPSAQLN